MWDVVYKETAGWDVVWEGTTVWDVVWEGDHSLALVAEMINS